MKDRFARFFGVRLFLAKKNSSFLSVISAISVGGVAVGVLVMVVILSVMAGFERELKGRLFKAETHVRIDLASPGQDTAVNGSLRFSADESLMEKIRQSVPPQTNVDGILQAEAVLKSGKRVSGAILKGISTTHWDRQKAMVVEWASEDFLGEYDSMARVLLGQELSYELGVVPGDVLTAVSPAMSGGPLGMAPRMKKFLVEGVYKSGVPEQELHVVYAHVRDVESFVRQAGVLSQIELTMKNLETAPVISRRLADELGKQYLVRSWQELNAHLFSSLKLERAAMFTMLAFIVLVAGFNILSLLTMSIIEKKRSIGILRAMGATKTQVTQAFVWMGVAVAVTGITIGVSLGLAICFFLKTYPIIELPDFYYDRTLPVLIDAPLIALICTLALLLVTLGAVIPAKRAAKLTPLSGIQS